VYKDIDSEEKQIRTHFAGVHFLHKNTFLWMMASSGIPLKCCYLRILTIGFWKAKGIISGMSTQFFQETPFFTPNKL